MQRRLASAERPLSYRLLGSTAVGPHDACGHPPGNGGTREQQVRGVTRQTTGVQQRPLIRPWMAKEAAAVAN